MMTCHINLCALITIALLGVTRCQHIGLTADCSRKDYDNCVRMADPLLTDPHLIFPDNMADIDHVCRTWSQFVDCIKRYIDNCFTESNRRQFNKAVESPVDSVHQMCTASSYQAEYLQHATCLKSTLTDDSRCGRFYKQLVGQVQGLGDMGKEDLCCSHHRFRECVLTETTRTCDQKLTVASKMLPSAFSRQILDKALSFLREQCSNYIPNSGDCPGYQSLSSKTDHYLYNDVTSSHRDRDRERDSNNLPQQTNNHIATQPVDTRYISTNDQVFSDNFPSTSKPLSWLPSGRDGRRKTTKVTEYEQTLNEDGTTSTRSNFGRGMSWEPTTKSTPDFSKDEYFKVVHYKPSTESWYPSANNHRDKDLNDLQSNQVDEPNQQGLAHFDTQSDGRDNPGGGASNLCLSLLLSCLCSVFLHVLT